MKRARSSLTFLFLLIILFPIYSTVAEAAESPPNQLFASQFGTVGYDSAAGVAADSVGNTFAVGSTDWFFEGETRFGEHDAFVRKIDITGNEVWTRQFGSNNSDAALDVDVDSSGNIYVSGYVNGPIPGQIWNGGGDAFVRKYDSSGTEQWTRQFGGSGFEGAYAVAVDTNGNVAAGGFTTAVMTGNTADSSAGAKDSWVRVFDTNGTEIWTKQFGTTGEDWLDGMDFDSSGELVVAGSTYGTMNATPNKGVRDAYIRKYDVSGNIVWTQMLGTTGFEFVSGLEIDSLDRVVVSGYTDSAFPGHTTSGQYDIYTAKFSSAGSLLWTDQFGTFGIDFGQGVAVDANNQIYVVGHIFGSLAGHKGGYDVVVRKLDDNGNTLWTKQSGTNANDHAGGIAISSSGTVHVVGSTAGVWPPLAGHIGGLSDALAIRYDTTGLDLPATTVSTAPSVPDGRNGWFSSSATITLTSDKPGTTEYQWNSTSPGSWTNYTAPFAALEGQNTLFFRSTDTDTPTNTEPVKGALVKVDTVDPTDPSSVTSSSHTTGVPSNDNTISISWSGASDAGSGVGGYSTSWTNGAADLPDETADHDFTTTDEVSPELADGSWYFHLRTQDKSGNWTSTVHLGPFEITGSGSDTVLPTGTFQINAGATVADTTSVTLYMNATDTGGSGLADMACSNDDIWDDTGAGGEEAWATYASTYAWILTSGPDPGTHWVYCKFRDGAGNVSALPIEKDDIQLDTSGSADTIPPTGSISINGGAADSNTVNVTLGLTASDNSGTVTQMRIWNDGENPDLATWEAFATSKPLSLPAGDGSKIVWVQFRDGNNNSSTPYSDSINLNAGGGTDEDPPTASLLLINGGQATTRSLQVTMTWGAPFDGASGLAEMRFWNYSPSSDPTCGGVPDNSAVWIPYGIASPWTMKPGASEGKRVCGQLKDAAGNVSTIKSRYILLIGSGGVDATPPTGTIKINGGVSVTSSSLVELNLSSTDQGGTTTQMRVWNDGANKNLQPWLPYVTTKSWTVPAGNGLKTVWVEFQDNSGNVSTPYSDIIQLNTDLSVDDLRPTGTVVINNGNSSTTSQSVTLKLFATDSPPINEGGSGVAEMRFLNAGVFGQAWSEWEPYGTTKTWNLVPGAGEKEVWVQYRDGAENASIPPAKDTITLTGAGGGPACVGDTQKPEGFLQLNGGDQETLSARVTIAISAFDLGGCGLDKMRFWNDGDPKSSAQWESYATSRQWDIKPLTTGLSGIRRVWAEFKDAAGNISVNRSDSIVLIDGRSINMYICKYPAGGSCTRNLVLGNTAKIAGFVKDANGQGQSGETVRIQFKRNDSWVTLKTVTTGSGGYFQYRYIPYRGMTLQAQHVVGSGTPRSSKESNINVDAKLVLWGSSSKITYGGWKKLHGLLTTTGGSGIGGKKVYLQRKDYGTGKWVWAKTAVTSSSGYYVFWVNPGEVRHYRVAAWGSAFISNQKTVIVRAAPYLNLSRTSIKLGESIDIRAGLRPAHSGNKMEIHYLDQGTKQWKKLNPPGTISTNSKGDIFFRWRPPWKGTWTLRVKSEHHWNHYWNYSGRRSFTVN